jgi:hypothetical protein
MRINPPEGITQKEGRNTHPETQNNFIDDDLCF